jgi:hypothetical protein
LTWVVLREKRVQYIAKYGVADYAWTVTKMLLLLPICAIYWVLFKLAEAFEWVSDRLVDAGYFVHDRVWEKKEDKPNE